MCIRDSLRAVGFKVDNEYYVNDAGRQMDILTVSIFFRYLTLSGEKLRFPDNGYQGKYIKDIAESVYEKYGDRWRKSSSEVYKDVCKDGQQGGDKESHIDELIVRSRQMLGEGYDTIFRIGIDNILDGIKTDLAAFGVNFEKWFLEHSLIDNGSVSYTHLTLPTKA